MKVRYYGIPVRASTGGMIVRWCDDDAPRSKAHDLSARHDLVDHSPDGFAWGYAGSGPSQLAIALCAHALEDDARAMEVYQRFKWRALRHLKQDEPWSLTRDEVLAVITDIGSTEKEAARDIAAVDRERPPVEHEGGVGPGGATITWDTDDAGRRRTPRGSDDE